MNERFYGRPGTATQIKSAFPQAGVLGLVECGTHVVIGAVVAGYYTAEADIYPGLHAELDSTMLLMAGRGFFSYRAWADSAATGAALLWRMKKNNVLPVEAELPDGSYLSAVYVNPKARRNNIDPIQVRVIEYTLTTGEQISEFRLITTILDPVAASAQDLAEAYAWRWEIESCFDELKTHPRGPGIVLRSKTPDRRPAGNLHSPVRALRPQVSHGAIAQDFDEDPLKFSFTRTLRAARRSPGFSPLRNTLKPSQYSVRKPSTNYFHRTDLAQIPASSNAKCPDDPSNAYQNRLSKRY